MASLNGLLMALIAAGFGAGLVLLVMFIHGVTPQPFTPPNRFLLAVQALRSPALSGRIAGGGVVGILPPVLTHRPAGAAGGPGPGVLLAPSVCGPRPGAQPN